MPLLCFPFNYLRRGKASVDKKGRNLFMIWLSPEIHKILLLHFSLAKFTGGLLCLGETCSNL